MESPLLGRLEAYPGLLQQVSVNSCSRYVAVLVEEYFNEFTEPRAVVVLNGFSIPERFQERVSLKELRFQFSLSKE